MNLRLKDIFRRQLLLVSLPFWEEEEHLTLVVRYWLALYFYWSIQTLEKHHVCWEMTFMISNLLNIIQPLINCFRSNIVLSFSFAFEHTSILSFPNIFLAPTLTGCFSSDFHVFLFSLQSLFFIDELAQINLQLVVLFFHQLQVPMFFFDCLIDSFPIAFVNDNFSPFFDLVYFLLLTSHHLLHFINL